MKTAEEILNEILIDVEDRPAFFREQDVADLIGQAQKEAFKEGQSNPKVKQLEWDVLYSSHYVKDTNPIGYRAKISEWHISTPKYVLSFAHSGEINAKIYDTLEEAKAAAQEDFEQRVKECLIIE